MAIHGKNWFAVGFGVAGTLAAITTLALTPALGVSTTSAPIHSVRKNGPVNLKNGDTTLVKLTLPAGRWLIVGKMWADSQASQPTPNTVVGCNIAKGSTVLDTSAFNTPKVGGAGGTSAGVNVLQAVVTLKSQATISFRCNDFGSQAVAHEIVLSATS